MPCSHPAARSARRVRILAVVATLALTACGGSSTASNSGPGRFPPKFRVTAVRGQAARLPLSGNSLDGFRAAMAEDVSAVEADFRLDADGDLVAAHDDALSGSCGSVRRSTTADLRRCRLIHGYRIATLGQLLALPFEEIYVDLKDTAARGADTRTSERVVSAVERAIDDVHAARRTSSVVIMVYESAPAIAALRKATGVRAGLKGHPETTTEAFRMNRVAAQRGFELVCIEIEQATVGVIADAARRGIWHLPWAGVDTKLAALRTLAANGVGGVITTRYDEIAGYVAPVWVSPARFARPPAE